MSFENTFKKMAEEIAAKSAGKIVLKSERQSFRLYADNIAIGRTMEIYAIFAENDGWEKAKEKFEKDFLKFLIP